MSKNINDMPSGTNRFVDYLNEEDKDSAVIHEILSLLHRQNLTYSQAEDVLEKAMIAMGLIRFYWSDQIPIQMIR
jgi:hypothetical protein